MLDATCGVRIWLEVRVGTCGVWRWLEVLGVDAGQTLDGFEEYTTGNVSRASRNCLGNEGAPIDLRGIRLETQGGVVLLVVALIL